MEAAVELQASASNNAPVTFSAANVPSGITVTSDGYIYGTFSGSENATMSVTASAAGCPDVTVSIVFSVTASGSGSGSGSGEGGEGGESGGSGSGEGGGGGGVALYVEGIQALKWDYSYLTGTYNLISGTHGTTTAVYRRTDSQYWIMYRGQWDIVDNAEGDGPAEDSNNGTLVTDNYWEHCSVTVN
jgi:hypothetical protein